jgi:KipI family sensor histidine kinase inhibitor
VITSRLRSVGRIGVLVEPDDPSVVAGLALVMRRAADLASFEIVPAASTILLRAAEGNEISGTSISVIEELLGRLDVIELSRAADSAELVEIDVVYDGIDLADVSTLTGLSADEVVRRHTAPTYRVAFIGFAPGFAYLAGGDPVLAVPRMPAPRPRVPHGAVAIAGPHTGVYPREMPGGWRIIGHTDAVMWDLGRVSPVLLQPGTRVRFQPTGP